MIYLHYGEKGLSLSSTLYLTAVYVSAKFKVVQAQLGAVDKRNPG